MKHCDVKEGKNNIDIYFLHEFALSSRSTNHISNHFNNLGYNTINCEYAGHGNRVFEKVSWRKTINEFEKTFKSRGNKTVLIGSSIGGTIALVLGKRNPSIDKVFSISAPNQRKLSRLYGKRNKACKLPSKDRYFLFHSRNDSVVPVTDFFRNKKALCIPDENVMLVDDVTGIGFIDHVKLKRDERVMDFISSHLESIKKN